MRKQINIMLKTLDSVLVFLMLLSLFIFIFAIMGMHLFGGLFNKLEV
jgi:voltage-dependent calcium channel T type alpha-1G